MNETEMKNRNVNKDIYDVNQSSMKEDAVPHFNGGCT
jgi:hypothetical protein